MTKPARRSRYVTTLLMGAAAVSLMGCEQDTSKEADVSIYKSIDACAKDFPLRECQDGMTEAQQQHQQTAPKFASAKECQDAGFEACEPAATAAVPSAQSQPGQTQTASGGSGSFMPILMGYMMGRAMSPGMGFGQPGMQQPATMQTSAATPTAASAPARPVYADKNGFLYSADRQVSRLAPGQSLSSTGATTVRTRVSPSGDLAGPRTVARGGFGSTGSRMSGGS